MAALKIKPTKICPVCGTEFEVKTINHIYCCRKCKNRQYYKDHKVKRQYHKGKRGEYFRKYHQEHRAERNAYSRLYRQMHPDYRRNYRAARKMENEATEEVFMSEPFSDENLDFMARLAMSCGMTLD